MEILKGPLGSHNNYICHIAIPNCQDYFSLQERNKEQNKSKTPDKYNELRLFVNAIESLNNIVDYYYYENEDSISYDNINLFRRAAFKKYPIIEDAANIANAYKHCVRENRKGKNTQLPWAKDLQNPSLNIAVDLTAPSGEMVNAKYEFEWPIKSHEETLEKSFKFWFSHGEGDSPSLASV